MSGSVRKRQGKFEQIPRWIVERADANSLRLWLILAKYADWQTGEAYPSRGTLAFQMGVSLRTVDRCKQNLLAIGALTWERRVSADTGYESNLYTLEWADPLETEVSLPRDTDVSSPRDTDGSLTRPITTKTETAANYCRNCGSPYTRSHTCFL